MKVIEKSEKKITILLEDGEEIDIVTLHGSKEKLTIKSFQSILHIDELSCSKIKEKAEEEREIKKMKDVLHKRKNIK